MINIKEIIEKEIILKDPEELDELYDALMLMDDRELSITCRALMTEGSVEFKNYYYQLIDGNSGFASVIQRIVELAAVAHAELSKLVDQVEYMDNSAVYIETLQKMIYVCNLAGYPARSSIEPVIASVSDTKLKGLLNTYLHSALTNYPSDVPK